MGVLSQNLLVMTKWTRKIHREIKRGLWGFEPTTPRPKERNSRKKELKRNVDVGVRYRVPMSRGLKVKSRKIVCIVQGMRTWVPFAQIYVLIHKSYVN